MERWQLFWREHGDREAKRVWREGWWQDQFEILEKQDFEALERLCARLGIELVRAGLDD